MAPHPVSSRHRPIQKGLIFRLPLFALPEYVHGLCRQHKVSAANIKKGAGLVQQSCQLTHSHTRRIRARRARRIDRTRLPEKSSGLLCQAQRAI